MQHVACSSANLGRGQDRPSLVWSAGEPVRQTINGLPVEWCVTAWCSWSMYPAGHGLTVEREHVDIGAQEKGGGYCNIEAGGAEALQLGPDLL